LFFVLRVQRYEENLEYKNIKAKKWYLFTYFNKQAVFIPQNKKSLPIWEANYRISIFNFHFSIFNSQLSIT